METLEGLIRKEEGDSVRGWGKVAEFGILAMR
jgi:hypothetical protein